MNVRETPRGFERIDRAKHADELVMCRLVQQSSAIGPYDDSASRPGTSYLWLDENHHLNREEVAELIEHLSAWVKTGSLKVAK